MFKILFFMTTMALAAPNAFDQKFNSLEVKMKPAQVKELLGAPDLREVKADKEIWHYSENGGRRVIFQKGRLQEFSKEESSLNLIPPTPAPNAMPILASPPPKDLPIGSECKNDSECKSDNCHFHRCAGPTNCTVPIGGRCATDNDCCAGKCDFQTCKKN